MGAERAMVVYGQDGLDEISLGAATLVGELRGGQIREYSIHPEDFGLAMASTRSLRVEDPEQSKDMLKAALVADSGIAHDIVALNAGAAIYVSGVAATLADGVQMAEDAIASGGALLKVEELVQFSQLAAGR